MPGRFAFVRRHLKSVVTLKFEINTVNMLCYGIDRKAAQRLHIRFAVPLGYALYESNKCVGIVNAANELELKNPMYPVK